MSIVGYSAIETAVIEQLIEHFSEELDPATCVAGDIDQALDQMFARNGRHCCVLEYGGGDKRRREGFNRSMWTWVIYGILMILYTGPGIETELRHTIDKLATTFENGAERLGGLSPLTEITRIEDPDPVKVNDTPFYWVPFVIEAIDYKGGT